MRFKKGSKVEVLNAKDVPSGSWRIAEIISGNGHNYFVRYAQYPPDSSMAVDRVPRKAIRPCPPPVEVLKDWMPGDVIEVLDNSSWKLAQVSRVIGGDYYSLKLLGSSKGFRAHKSLIRMQQFWQNNKWLVVQKDSGKQNVLVQSSLSKGGKVDYQLTQSCVQVDNFLGRNHFSIEDYDVFGESIRVSSIAMRKRKFEPSPTEESCTNASRKMRVIEKDRRHQKIVAGNLLWLQEKVGAVASAHKVLGEKYMHSSLNNREASITQLEREIPNPDNQYLTRLEHSDTESTSSSVGSCSISNSAYRSPYHYVSISSQDMYSHSRHAETSCGLGRELSLPSKEELRAEVHQLELHAFRSVMAALYASGPINWEQEALMTNLRLMLNISNDEYLSELRNLMSE